MSRTRRQRSLTALLALACLLGAGALGGAADAEAGKKKKKKAVPLAKRFDTRVLASGFRRPVSFAFLPNGKMLVGEKFGNIWIVDRSGNTKLLMSLAGRLISQRERGLEGIEVASDFAVSRRVYLNYTYAANPLNPTGPQALRVTYIQLDSNDNVYNPSNPETVVLGKDATRPCPAISNKLDCPASISAVHQGGTVISAPDKTLWIGYGDSNLPASLGNQVFRTFNPKSTAGKILHVDANGKGLKKHPFCKKTKNRNRTCTKIYATGFRNPFRFTLTPKGQPLVGDVGWNEREEINLVRRGANYGWPCKEGSIRTPFYRDRARCKRLYRSGKLKDPIYEYENNRENGAAVIVGPQAQTTSYPKRLRGAYFFGDYANLFIKGGVLRKGKLRGIRTVATGAFPVQFRVAPNGNISYVDFIKGTINELIYAPNKAPRATASASPPSFCPPATRPVTFSAAGTTDPEGDRLTYHWSFGDGAIGAGPTATHAYPGPGTYTATLRVSDGISASTASVKVFAGNCPPSMSVFAPRSGARYHAGQVVPLRGNGSDPDQSLPNSAFSWDVVLVHKQHRHDLGIFSGRAAQFRTVTDHDADSHYLVTPSVTDARGYTKVLPTITLVPDRVSLRLKSNIGKVRITYGGRTVGAPRKIKTVPGYKAEISAPIRVRRNGKVFKFVAWGKRRKRTRIYPVPSKKKLKLVARYKRVR